MGVGDSFEIQYRVWASHVLSFGVGAGECGTSASEVSIRSGSYLVDVLAWLG